jgi:hypothetical protein
VDPQPQGAFVGDAVAVPEDVVPHLACRAELADVLEEVHADAEAHAAEGVRQLLQRHRAAAAHLVEMGDVAGEQRTEFLERVQSGIGAVVAGHRDRHPVRKVLVAELDDVAVDLQRGVRRDLVQRGAADVGEEEVGLAGAVQLVEAQPAPQRHVPVRGHGER